VAASISDFAFCRIMPVFVPVFSVTLCAL